jgi:2,4-didehydro-3-deoxy-L-rhamnonate hydrolase
MRMANVDGRVKVLVDGGAVDVQRASRGRLPAHPQAAYEHFDELVAWSSGVTEADEPFAPDLAGPPSPTPRQVFGIGINYRDHAAESGHDVPDFPVVFTKYVSAFSGPVSTVALPPGSVDWEVEVVAVIGRTARAVPAAQAWAHVAGLTVGQDLSERELQRRGPAAQFGLGKSYPGFAPTGPSLVTPDELERPDDLAVGCEVNGEARQQARSADMVFGVSELVSYLSGVLTLYPGDVIFTGTPPGVGMGRTPPVFLRAGDHLHSWIEGIGELDQRFTAAER